MVYKLTELEKKYNIEFEKIIENIKAKKPKSILLQFPDGLKQYATEIYDYIKEKTKIKDIRIHLGSCFGACDIPRTETELIIQFGHAPWTNNSL